MASWLLAAAAAAGMSAAPAALTLHEAVASALALDPRVRQAELELERAGVTARGAEAERLQYSGDLSIGNWTGATGLLSDQPITPMSVPIGNAQLAARVPVFTGGRLGHQIEAAEAGVAVSRARLDQARQDLVFAVSEAYWLARRGELRAAIRSEAAAQARQARELVRASVAIGKAGAAELDRAEVALLNEESELLRAESEAAQARDKLGALLRRDLAGVALASAPPAGGPEPMPADDARVRAALEERPDVRLARAEVAAREAGLGVAAADRWPQMELLSAYQHGNNPFFATSQNRSVLDRFVGTWNAQLNLSYHLFDHGVIERNVQGRSLELEAGKQALAAARAAAELESRQARRRLELATRRLQLGARSEALAAKNLKWVEGRFKYGYALLTELNEARLNLVSARNQRLDAEIDHQLAAAAMRKALGRLEPPGRGE